MQEQSIGPVENLVRWNGPRRRNVPLASAPLALARYSSLFLVGHHLYINATCLTQGCELSD